MNLLKNPVGRAFLFTALYASEGAPIGFIWWGLPAILRERGSEVGQITSVLAAVTAMWALKFLWAPVVDALRGPRWGFRSWIITAQLLMGLTLLPLAWLDPLADLTFMAVLLVAHAFCATTQDVSIDALAINTVPRAELGRINGFMSAGKFIGRGLFGGVALIVADELGWQWIIFGMIGMIWCSLVLVWLLPEGAGTPDKPSQAPPVQERLAEFGKTLKAAFARRTTWLAIGFALVSGAGFEAAGALTSPYLVDRGISLADIGKFRTFAVVGAMIAGCLLGGALTDRLGRVRGTMIFLLGFVATIFALGACDLWYRVPWALMTILAMMYFCYGMFIAASYALFMDLTDPKIGGTQFSTFMAATNACESWSAGVSGPIVDRSGYAPAFFIMSIVSLLALPLLKQLRPAVPKNSNGSK